MDLSVLWELSYGMYVVSGMDGERPVGCVVNTVTQITSENPVIAVSIHKDNYTYGVLKQTKKLAVSILGEDVPSHVFGLFGYQSSRDIDKFQDISYQTVGGMPVLAEGCCGYLIAEVLSVVDCETHGIFLARVTDTKKETSGRPMTYRYFHEVIKGKAPKNAPTFQKEETLPKEQYVCSICGYIYEGDISSEPDSYVCPICSAPKAAFQKK